jgi:monofunctional biosynthetic peptidoglycan transglycosylase
MTAHGDSVLRAATRLYMLGVVLGTPLALIWVPAQLWPAAWLLVRLTFAIQFVSVAVVWAVRWLNPPTSAFIVLAAIGHLRRRQPSQIAHTWVAEAGLPPALRLAAIVAEDTYFAFHAGFDWDSLRTAYTANREGGPPRGGSTISQQVAKNLFLWETPSYLRKAIEAYFTLLIEAAWPKRRILEVYLNIARFGPRTFGAEAAARRFFGKPAADLSRQEAALLVAVLPAPLNYRAEAPAPLVRARQVMIMARMKQTGEGHLARLDTLHPLLPGSQT